MKSLTSVQCLLQTALKTVNPLIEMLQLTTHDSILYFYFIKKNFFEIMFQPNLEIRGPYMAIVKVKYSWNDWYFHLHNWIKIFLKHRG